MNITFVKAKLDLYGGMKQMTLGRRQASLWYLDPQFIIKPGKTAT